MNTATAARLVQAPTLAPTYPDPLAELRQVVDTLSSTSTAARDAAKPQAQTARRSRASNRRETTMSDVTAAVTPQALSNSLSFSALMQIAADLGSEAGK